MSEKEPTDINIGDFIDTNSNLFVVLGVFSALAIYIYQLRNAQSVESLFLTRLGVQGSLVLSALIIIQIYKKLINKAGSFDNFVESLGKSQNWELIVFTVGLVLLIPSIVAPLLEFEESLYWTLGLLGLFYTMPLLLNIISNISVYIPEESISKELAMILVGLISFTGSAQILKFIFGVLFLSAQRSFLFLILHHSWLMYLL